MQKCASIASLDLASSGLPRYETHRQWHEQPHQLIVPWTLARHAISPGLRRAALSSLAARGERRPSNALPRRPDARPRRTKDGHDDRTVVFHSVQLLLAEGPSSWRDSVPNGISGVVRVESATSPTMDHPAQPSMPPRYPPSWSAKYLLYAPSNQSA